MQMNRREFLGGLALAAAGEGIIDTHTHFYDPTRPQGVPWPPKNDPILYQPTLPERFRKLAGPLRVAGTIVVEASAWIEDNQWVLDLAKENPIILGLVGRLEPGAEEFRQQLARFRKNRLFLGIRVGAKPLAEGLARPAFLEDLKRLADAGLELDVVGGLPMLPDVVRLSDKLPGLRVVIDHLPFDRQTEGGALRELGARPRVYAKVSSVLRRIDGRVPAELAFYQQALDELWEIFGADRVLYGSNWPVSERIAPYAEVLRIVREYVTRKGPEASAQYFRHNAASAYHFGDRLRVPRGGLASRFRPT